MNLLQDQNPEWNGGFRRIDRICMFVVGLFLLFVAVSARSFGEFEYQVFVPVSQRPTILESEWQHSFGSFEWIWKFRSPVERPIFWLVNVGLFSSFVYVVGRLIRRRRIAADPSAWAHAEAVRQAREFKTNALHAVAANNPKNFYVFARSALRARFGFPEGLSKSELEAKLTEAPEKTAAKIRRLVAHSDAIAFEKWIPSEEELRADKIVFRELLEELEGLDQTISVFEGRR